MVLHTTTVNNEPLGYTLSIDGYLTNILKDVNEYKNKNFDCVGIVTGEEGSGKTTLAMQMCSYMDKDFNNDHIIFNGRQFEEAIQKLPKGSTILWDEADDVGSAWASEMMITLKKTFKRIRKNNFFILLVTPTFHDLNKYFAIHRARFLINVHTDFTTRGFFKFYNRKAKRMLYIYGKKEMNMSAYKCTLFGRFPNYPKGFPIDFEAYEAAKDKATMETFDKVQTPKNIRKEILFNLIAFMDKNKYPYTKTLLSTIIGIDNSTVGRYIKEEGGGV